MGALLEARPFHALPTTDPRTTVASSDSPQRLRSNYSPWIHWIRAESRLEARAPPRREGGHRWIGEGQFSHGSHFRR
jgi:hypothetical protein